MPQSVDPVTASDPSPNDGIDLLPEKPPVILTEAQKEALRQATNLRATTFILGFAGVGKTEVLAEAARRDTASPVLAPTNKAASVLRSKGIPAQTLHSFMYAPAEKAKYKKNADGTSVYQRDAAGNLILDTNGEPIPHILSSDLSFTLREDVGDMHRVFVDETSMLGPTQLLDLQKAFRHVVLFGDRFQLPPVNARDILKDCSPHSLLTEVHRTAADNPILKLLTAMRTPGYVMPQEWEPVGDNLRVADANNKRLIATFVEKNVQVICYSNALRHDLNERIRSFAGLPPSALKAGETLICLDNVRVSDPITKVQSLKFYNGEMLTVAEDVADPGDHYSPVNVKFTNGKRHMMWPFFRKDFWREYESNNKATWNNNILRLRSTGRITYQPALFDFSGAITGHKAQGSEWPLVAVYHQRSTMARRMDQTMALRWLYTSFGRTRNRLLIVNS